MLRLASKRLLGLGFGEALSSSSAAKLLLPRLYHERVVDHYNNPRNVGSFDKNDPTVGTGLVGAPACGDVMKLQIKVDDQTGKIVDACFKTFGCGSAIASSSVGNFHWTLEDVAKSIVCIMSCPCQAGYTQMLNDWYDREIDAINEPYRPIPSGAISENEAGQGIAFGRSFPSYIYSAQPLKLEESKFVFEATIIQRMKPLVLSTLQWKMNSLTPFSFVDHIARRIGLKTDLHLEFLWRCMFAQSLDLFDKS